jgi:hypothetical protein
MSKDRDDAAPRFGHDLHLCKIGTDGAEVNLALRSQPFGLRQPDGGPIDRRNGVPACGQEDGIPPLPLGQA